MKKGIMILLLRTCEQTHPCMKRLVSKLFLSYMTWRWAEKFIGWLWCNGWIYQMWFILQHSLWSAHFFHQCCSTWIPVSIEALILILEKVFNCRYDLITSPILLPSQVLFGEQKTVKWCQIRKMWRMVNQCKATLRFHAVHEMSLVLLLKVRNYLSSVGLSGRKQCS